MCIESTKEPHWSLDTLTETHESTTSLVVGKSFRVYLYLYGVALKQTKFLCIAYASRSFSKLGNKRSKPNWPELYWVEPSINNSGFSFNFISNMNRVRMNHQIWFEQTQVIHEVLESWNFELIQHLLLDYSSIFRPSQRLALQNSQSALAQLNVLKSNSQEVQFYSNVMKWKFCLWY